MNFFSGCEICKQDTSTSKNYLLRCAQCRSYFHHRHHIPPVSDHDLIARIRADKQGDPKNGLTAWICSFCMAADASEPPRMGLKRLSTNDAIPRRKEPTEVIEISDSESPPPQPSAALPEVVSLLSSDDEGVVQTISVEKPRGTIVDIMPPAVHPQPQARDATPSLPPPSPIAETPTFQRNLAAAPITYLPPPWLEGRSTDTPSRSRKPKKLANNPDTFFFSITSWMAIRKE